ncbi:FkbM family methyltransferase [Helicobacter muridarum]|nr:FkbM family methyltransferase [Helicobacter muridarum]
MRLAHKILLHIAKILTFFIPIRSIRRKVRGNIIDFLAFFPLLFVRGSNLHKRLLAIIALSNSYQYKRGEYRFPNYGEDVFHIQNVNENMGGGGTLLLEFYSRYDMIKIEQTLELFCDEYSKMILVSALIHRYSNLQGLYIIHFYEHIWKYYYLLEASLDTNKSIESSNGKLYYIDLSLSKNINLGNFKLYYSVYGIFVNFILEQYAYRHLVYAKDGDYVIDGGACYGDTALYFAHKVGQGGKVFSFEFNEDNLEIFHKNMSLNSDIKNITLFTNALYSDSKTKVYHTGSGGGSKLSLESQDNQEYTMSVSIDDLVDNGKIDRVDFIKMDIEGSELAALKGAEKTLKTYNPKIAICLYHSDSDYYDIPLYLKSILPHYEFYCDHFTLGVCESVLFGRPSNS